MPIQWKPRDNKLTTPHSYAAFPVISQRLNIDDLAELISAQIPVLSPPVIRATLVGFHQEVAIQLGKGNGITLANFLSFYPTISQRIDDDEERIEDDSLEVKCKVSQTLIDEIKVSVTFEKLPYLPTKKPEILSVRESNSNLERWVEQNSGLTISGNNLEHDPFSTDEGLYLLSPAGNYIKQDNLSENKNAQVILTAKFDTVQGPAGYASVENVLDIRTRYTENGSLRVGEYSGKIRQTNYIGNLYSNHYAMVVGESSTTGPVEIISFPGSTNKYILTSILDTSDNLFLELSTVLAPSSPLGSHEITLDNQIVVFQTDVGNLELEVLSYQQLFDNTTEYNRFLREVLLIDEVNPYTVFDISRSASYFDYGEDGDTATRNSYGWVTCFLTDIIPADRKVYFEIEVLSNPQPDSVMVGISDDYTEVTFPGESEGTYGLFSLNGNRYTDNASQAFCVPYTSGDIIGVFVDLTSGKMWYSVNNVVCASGDPENGLNPAFSSVTSNIASIGLTRQTASINARVQQVDLTYDQSSIGFEPLKID